MNTPLPTPRPGEISSRGRAWHWPRGWLIAAGLYNLAWGAFVIIWPNALFTWSGMEPLNHPSIWQCLGMIVGVYGIGYLVAARDHRRHWPIVLVGLLGKLFGPIGFVMAWWRGDIPLAFGVTLLTNDLIWWIPFALMLRDAARPAAARDSEVTALQAHGTRGASRD